ncbi:MAG TPA: helix-turn-helix transcriptional regulator [Firmicutes bacterium]|nr:helix-turn-helix transcriptional regulator [Bacillota bacterium]
MNRFGKALKELRQRSGLRQDDLAKVLGVERSTVANWERGAKQPSIDVLIKLSQIFGVSLDQLVGISTTATPIAAVRYLPLASDPLVRLLAEKTGVPAKTIAAFITALKIPNGNSGLC